MSPRADRRVAPPEPPVRAAVAVPRRREEQCITWLISEYSDAGVDRGLGKVNHRAGRAADLLAPPQQAGPVADLGSHPIVTLDDQLLKALGNLV
jgi:hypothetical protein